MIMAIYWRLAESVEPINAYYVPLLLVNDEWGSIHIADNIVSTKGCIETTPFPNDLFLEIRI